MSFCLGAPVAHRRSEAAAPEHQRWFAVSPAEWLVFLWILTHESFFSPGSPGIAAFPEKKSEFWFLDTLPEKFWII